MAIKLNFDPAIFKWQAKYGEKMTYALLAKRAGITEPTIYRLTSGQATKLDLGKLNRLCKVLECDPGDLLTRIDTNAVSGFEEAKWRQEWHAQDVKTLRQFTENSDPLGKADNTEN